MPARTAPVIRTRRIPQPNVVDRGSDFVAVARSLVLFSRWIGSTNPDPALVGRVFQSGTPAERSASSQARELRRDGERIVVVDRVPLELAVISITPNVVSLSVTEHLAHRELVAADGRILDSIPARTEHLVVSIMRASSEFPWRVNLFDWAAPKIEVQL